MTRRKFLKTLAAAGLTAFGGWNSRLWAGGVFDRNSASGRAPQRSQLSQLSQRLQNGYIPPYIELEASGELKRREQALWAKMESCSLCPRMCGVNRLVGRRAVCNTDHTFRVAVSTITFGEERVIVGTGGAGSIFMSNCNLLCVSCQNWEIAHRGDGRLTTHAEFADMMLTLQKRGAHNVGIVTPTHIVPHMVTALRLAIKQGLYIPLIYDTSGYETVEVLRLLDGIVDVYQPDFKFQDCEFAAPFLSGAPRYAYYTAAAIKEMNRQVGKPEIIDGITNRGLIIRHLVLPENAAGTDRFVRWVVSELGTDTHVTIMRQFWPAFQARHHPPLHRRLTAAEFNQAMSWAREAGLWNFH